MFQNGTIYDKMYHMTTNGRSATPHHITTSDETRRARWLHLFGADHLPVYAAKPRWQPGQQGGGFDVLAYDLALGELSDAQRQRFAGYLSRKHRVDYMATLTELETAVSWPIKASTDVMVVEPAAQLPLASLLPAWDRVAGMMLRHKRGLWRRLAGV